MWLLTRPGGRTLRRRDVIVQGQADLLQVVDTLARRAASRAAWTAGNSRAIRTAMIAITTSNSISVNAFRPRLDDINDSL